MRDQRRWLIGAGCGAFAWFLLEGIPAGVATGWIGAGSLRLSAVSGTLWHGSADSVVAGKLRLGVTEWSLSPVSLLLGRLRADVQTQLGDARASGVVTRHLTGTLTCTNCRFAGPVSALWPAFPSLKAVDGRLDLEITTLEIKDGWPIRAVGTARLSGSFLQGSGTVPGGSPSASFAAVCAADPVPSNGRIAATVEDSGGPLLLSAKLELTPPGNFTFSGRALARPGAPAAIANALAALGPRGPDGSTPLTMTGTF